MAYNVSEIQETTNPTVETEGVVEPGTSHIEEAVLNRMADIIGEDGEELTKILEWIKARGAESPEQMLWEFRNIINTLSTPRIGESKLKRVYRYIALDSTVRDAKKQMQQMEAQI